MEPHPEDSPRQRAGLFLFSTAFVLSLTAWVGAQTSPDTWTVTVNGRTVDVAPDGSFVADNVPASNGNLIRIQTIAQRGPVTLHGASSFFELLANDSLKVSFFPLSPQPIPAVQSLVGASNQPTLTNLGDSTQVTVMAMLSDGTTADVSARAAGTTYQSSNPAIVSVDVDGIATAVEPGIAFITALNQGAATVTALSVSPGDPLTTVEGHVRDPGGLPVAGATVTLFVGASVFGTTTTDADGRFCIGCEGGGCAPCPGTVPTQLGPLSLVAQATVGNEVLTATVTDLPPVPGGVTDAGVLFLDSLAIWISDVSGNWSDDPSWLPGVPQDGQRVVIDRPASDPTVTYSAGDTSVQLNAADPFALTGGTLSLSQNSSLSSVTITNGTLNVDGPTVVSGPAQQSGGNVSVSDTLTVEQLTATGGSLQGPGQVDLGGFNEFSGGVYTLSGGVTVDNLDETTQPGGLVRIQDGSAFNNLAGAVFDVQSDADLDDSITGGTFNNAGTFRKSAGTGTSFVASQIAFNNDGTVEVQSGTLDLQGGGTQTGTVQIDADTNAIFRGTTIFDGASVLGDGTATLNGDMSVTTQVTFDTGAVLMGDVGGAGIYEHNALSELVNVTFSDSATSRFLGTSTISSGTSLISDDHVVENGGIFNQQNGLIRLRDGAVFNNLAGATFDMQTDNFIDDSITGGIFNNAGIFRKSAGTGTSTVSALIAFNNDGTVEVQSGTVQLLGGGEHLGSLQTAVGTALRFGGDTNLSGGSISGDGRAEVVAGTTTNLLDTWDADLGITGGTLDLAVATVVNGNAFQTGGTIAGDDLTVTEIYDVTGGVLTGSSTTQLQGGAQFHGGTVTVAGGRTVENQSSASWTSGLIRVQDGAVFNNLAGATFDVQTDGFFDNSATGGTFQNDGTLRKSAGSGTTTFSGQVQFNNDGTVEVQSGTLNLTGGGTHTGTAEVDAGATLALNNPNTVLQDTSIAGDGEVTLFADVTTVGTNEFDVDTTLNGTLGGDGSSNFNESLILASSTMTDAGTTNLNGATTVASGTNLVSGGHTVNQSGTLNHQGGLFRIRDGSVFNNLSGATFDVQGDHLFDDSITGGTFNNLAGATFVKSNGGGMATFANLVVFNNDGSVTVQSGTLGLMGGGSHTGDFFIDPAATLRLSGSHDLTSGTASGGGVLDIVGDDVDIAPGILGNVGLAVSGGNLDFDQATTLGGPVTISAGSLGGAGDVTVPVGAPVDITGGAVDGTGKLIGNGGVHFSGGTLKQITGGYTVENGGNGTWQGSGTLRISDGSVFNNLAGATFDVQNDAFFDDSITGGTFDNDGTFRKSTGAGTTTFSALVPFDNSGSVEAQSGVLSFLGGYAQTAGTTVLEGGNITATSFDIVGGALVGSGSVTANVDISGMLTPSDTDDTGAVAVNGNLDLQGAATLAVNIAGTGAGQFDTVTSTLTTNLAGTLQIDASGYSPQLGDTFQILSAGTGVTGTFATVDGTDLGGGFQLDVTYGPSAVILEVIQP